LIYFDHDTANTAAKHCCHRKWDRIIKRGKRIFSLSGFVSILLLFLSGCQPVQAQLIENRQTPAGNQRPETLLAEINGIRYKDLKRAKRLCGEAIQKAGPDKVIAGRLWNLYGSLYWQSGNLEEGIYCHRMARQNYLDAKDTGRAAYSLSEIGIYLYYAGLRDSVMHYYLQSVEEMKPLKQYSKLPVVFYHIGVFFSDQKNYEKGRYYYSRGLASARENKDSSVLINLLFGLGRLANTAKEWKLAARYLGESLQVAEALKRTQLAAMVSTDLSIAFLQARQLDSALYFGNKAMNYALASRNISTYVKACINMAEAYEITGQEKERMAVLRKALAQEKEIKNVVFAGGVYKWLADASYKLGAYKQAYDYLQNLNQVNDSTAEINAKRLNTELEARYQAAQKEKELAQREIQLQKTRQVLLFTLGVAFIVLLLAALLYFVYRHKNRMHQQALKTIRQEKEIQLLQAVMQGEEKERSRIAKDLHDGVAGMLAAVKMQLSSLTTFFTGVENNSGYRQAMEMLNDVSHEVRKTAHNLMPEVLTRYGLDEALRRYCANISSEQHLRVEYDFLGTPTRFAGSFELSVYRIVQELLTNVMKHSRASEAIVQVSQQQDGLFITVEDNGIGFPGHDADDEGMGLHSLRSRVDALHGKIDLVNNGQRGVSAYLEFDITEFKKEPVLPYEYENPVGYHR
jgi:signal transduction histidine kinase